MYCNIKCVSFYKKKIISFQYTYIIMWFMISYQYSVALVNKNSISLLFLSKFLFSVASVELSNRYLMSYLPVLRWYGEYFTTQAVVELVE